MSSLDDSPFTIKQRTEFAAFCEFIEAQKGDIRLSELRSILKNREPKEPPREKRRIPTCPTHKTAMKFCAITSAWFCKCGYSVRNK